MNTDILNICRQVFVWIYTFSRVRGRCPGVKLLGHMVDVCLTFLKKIPNSFHSYCTILRYHQDCMFWFSFSTSLMIPSISSLFDYSSNGSKWYLFVVSMYTSLMTNEIKHI